MSKAFTLIELLVVVSIIVLMTALTLPNYQFGNNQLALQRSAHKIAQDLRRAQEMSMSSKEVNGVISPGGYGIFFWKYPAGGYDYPHLYILFADLNNNGVLDFGPETVEIIELEGGVKLSDFYLDEVQAVGSYLTFIPPDPKTCIVECAYDSTRIVISIEDNPGEIMTISVNKAGLIAVE